MQGQLVKNIKDLGTVNTSQLKSGSYIIRFKTANTNELLHKVFLKK